MHRNRVLRVVMGRGPEQASLGKDARGNGHTRWQRHRRAPLGPLATGARYLLELVEGAFKELGGATTLIVTDSIL